MPFYDDNWLTTMDIESDRLDSFYAPLSSKRTYGEMCRDGWMSPSGLGYRNVVGSASSSFSGELQQVNDIRGGSGGKYHVGNPQGGIPSEETVSLPANDEHQIPGLDSAANEATGHDTADIAHSASDKTGAEYGLAAGKGARTIFKQEREETHLSLISYGGSEYDESECGSEYDESEYDGRRRTKIPKLNKVGVPRKPCGPRPKLNKDGVPRKPRQTRPKLLKWDSNDWKNVVLGIVWACGENGIQIPFDQASQVVNESCTAGSLQQALLKLRMKQVAEGFHIPSLRMSWPRKNKNSTSSMSSANPILSQGKGNNHLRKKQPTCFLGTQTNVVTLKRAYVDANRVHLPFPYNLTNAQRANEATQHVKQAPQQVHEAIQEIGEVAQHAATAPPMSPMAILSEIIPQPTGGFGFDPSQDYPVVATNANADASYHVPEPQTSPGYGPFGQTFRMPMTPALRTVYEESEDENTEHGLPLPH